MGKRHRGPVLGAAVASTQALVIQFKDPTAVLKTKLPSALAEGAVSLAPKAMESLVYSGGRDEIDKQMKAKGIDADVRVVETSPTGSSPTAAFLPGVAVGAVGVGLAFGLWKVVRGLFKK
jgi:hypothetical protein